MSIYVDSSALLKLYVEEDESDAAEAILGASRDWTTGRHTYVEVRRNLARLLDGRDLAAARSAFGADWESIDVVELSDEVCEAAAAIAERTSVRSLDALHLGAAQVVGGGTMPIVTFDTRQAEAARALGWPVFGA